MTNKVFFSKTLFPAVQYTKKCDHMLLTYHFVLTVNMLHLIFACNIFIFSNIKAKVLLRCVTVIHTKKI